MCVAVVRCGVKHHAVCDVGQDERQKNKAVQEEATERLDEAFESELKDLLMASTYTRP